MLSESFYIKQKEIPNQNAHKGAIMGCAWSPLHSNIIATSRKDGMVKFWDLAGLSFITEVKAHACGCNNLVFNVEKEQQFITSGIED